MLVGLMLLLLPAAADAHSFGEIYYLPIPFRLYAWSAAAALIASFIVVGLFAARAAPGGADASSAPARRSFALPLWLLRLLQGSSVVALLMCIATGWFGTPSAYANFNMTFFWIVFVLGFAYLTVLMGNLYALVSPWYVLARCLARLWPNFDRGVLRYPWRLGYWPAIVLYMAFIWIELIGHSKPFSLASLLAGYTLLNLFAVWLVGSRAWFRYGEFFAVFLGLLARMAPVEFIMRDDDQPTRRLRFRWPLAGLLQHRREHASLMVFVLFMLASTAFDGLHDTQPWYELYWLWFYQNVLVHWVGTDPFVAFPELRRIFMVWQSGWLLMSPFVYLAFYAIGIGLMVLLTGARYGFMSLALRFLPSLLPIALVYHFTHYYTLMQTQGIKIIALVSDPFGRGHNWFGTADWFARSSTPDMTNVWHVQVSLIVLGHVASVYIAHLEALRLFDTRARTALSQVPMLALMVAFTTAGLWILAQPFQGSV